MPIISEIVAVSPFLSLIFPATAVSVVSVPSDAVSVYFPLKGARVDAVFPIFTVKINSAFAASAAGIVRLRLRRPESCLF